MSGRHDDPLLRPGVRFTEEQKRKIREMAGYRDSRADLRDALRDFASAVRATAYGRFLERCVEWLARRLPKP